MSPSPSAGTLAPPTFLDAVRPQLSSPVPRPSSPSATLAARACARVDVPASCAAAVVERAVAGCPHTQRRLCLSLSTPASHSLRTLRGVVVTLLSRSSEAMGEPSKELLDLPSGPNPPSFIESLFAGREQHKGTRKAGPPTDPLPKSQVLGKVKDFLGEMAKANEKLQLDAQNKPPEEYDIEALTGNEKEYIEMVKLIYPQGHSGENSVTELTDEHGSVCRI
uniref:Uncharacterized protein n=1 Tax=Triticum urartu TaxID=4572 RepID=A0A8R7PS11_TRIUA